MIDTDNDTQTDDGQGQSLPGQEGQTSGTDATTTTQPSAGGDDLKAALAELTRGVQSLAQPKQQEPAQLTPEQRAQLFAVYSPDEEFKRHFLGLDETVDPKISEAKLAQFAKMQEGLVKQAVVTARHLLMRELAPQFEQLNPIREYVSQQEAKERQSRFYEKYETLKSPQYQKVVNAIAPTLAAKEFKDEDEFFKALAEGAAEHIRGLIPEFSLESKQQKPAGQTLRLPRTSVGGTGGAGAGGSSKQASDDDVDSLD